MFNNVYVAKAERNSFEPCAVQNSKIHEGISAEKTSLNWFMLVSYWFNKPWPAWPEGDTSFPCMGISIQNIWW